MTLSMAIFTFINAWWISLFLVRPFYVKPAIRWKKMMIANTIFSLLMTALLYAIIHSDFIHVRS